MQLLVARALRGGRLRARGRLQTAEHRASHDADDDATHEDLAERDKHASRSHFASRDARFDRSVAAGQRGARHRAGSSSRLGLSSRRDRSRAHAAGACIRVFPRCLRRAPGRRPAAPGPRARRGARLWPGRLSQPRHRRPRYGTCARAPPDVVHITVVGRNAGQSRPGLIIHTSAALDRRDTRQHQGLPVTAPARTILDVTPVADRPRARAALRRGPGHAGSCAAARSARCSSAIPAVRAPRASPRSPTRTARRPGRARTPSAGCSRCCARRTCRRPRSTRSSDAFELDFFWREAASGRGDRRLRVPQLASPARARPSARPRAPGRRGDDRALLLASGPRRARAGAWPRSPRCWPAAAPPRRPVRPLDCPTVRA